VGDKGTHHRGEEEYNIYSVFTNPRRVMIQGRQGTNVEATKTSRRKSQSIIKSPRDFNICSFDLGEREHFLILSREK